MPRRGKASRSDRAPVTGAVTVVAGSIRTADDPTALDVKLSIWDTEVTMRADGAELGHWPADAVSITPIDAFSFEFVAEGDRLIFSPNNPDDFNNHPIVAGAAVARRRKNKSKEKKAPATPPELRWDESTEAEAKVRKKAVEEKQPTRRERKAAAREAKAAIAAAEAARQVNVPVSDYDSQPRPAVTRRSTRATAESPIAASVEVPYESRSGVETDTAAATARPARAKKERAPKERRTREPKTAGNGHSRFAELRHRAWISSLDFARHYDLFGLDRVPVNESLRGQPDHPHTWEHRVAPASGPGSFICTICGAVRRKD